MSARKRRTKATDPFTRACEACGAAIGEACNTVGKNSKPLVSRASRLVHATRIEGDPQ